MLVNRSAAAATTLQRSRLGASALRALSSSASGSPDKAEQEYIVPTYASKGLRMKEGLVFERGQGSTMTDEQGKEYVDMGAGIAVTVLGHNDKEWKDAITDQLGKVAHMSNLYHTRPSLELAERLIKHSPGMGKVFFCNSGTEANEGALKFARVIQNARGEGARDRFVAFKQSFHGRTLGALSVTYKPAIREPFKPLLIPNVDHLCFNCIPSLERALANDVAAVIVEPVQGEGGIMPASREFLSAARELCDAHGALLIFDEVQIGLGRQGNGHLWGYEEYGVVPDFVTMAKPLANGLPIGAIMISERAYDSVDPKVFLGSHGSTFAANPLVTRAANVVLDKVTQPAFKGQVKENGAHLIAGLEAMRKRVGDRVTQVRRPLGDAALYAGLQLPSAHTGDVIKHCLDNGVLVLGAGDTGMVIRLCPPLTISKQEIDTALGALEKAIMACVPLPSEAQLEAVRDAAKPCSICPKNEGQKQAAALPGGLELRAPAAEELASSSTEEYERKLAEHGHTTLPDGFRIGVSGLEFFPAELPRTSESKPASMKLTVIAPDTPTSSYAALFTQNAFPGAPVKVGRELLAAGKPLGALVINNKISNVHPRGGGVDDARAVCGRTAELLGLEGGAGAVMPSSTGVIGWRLPRDEMLAALPKAVENLQRDSILPAARGIMTTDTFPKARSVAVVHPESGETLGRVTGIAKGAGMIEPNMATMLVYVLTDIPAESALLQRVLREAVNAEGSFNRISVDADQSTSDTIALLSSNARAALPDGATEHVLRAAVGRVCAELAQDVVRNGEGTAHVIKCTVTGASSSKLAHGVAKAVVNSPLCKTAVAGNDPNLGRLIAAVGSYVGKVAPAQAQKIARDCEIRVGGKLVLRNSEFDLDSERETELIAYLKDAELPNAAHYPAHYKTVDIEINLNPKGPGGHGAVVFGADLTDTYVEVNAGYRS